MSRLGEDAEGVGDASGDRSENNRIGSGSRADGDDEPWAVNGGDIVEVFPPLPAGITATAPTAAATKPPRPESSTVSLPLLAAGTAATTTTTTAAALDPRPLQLPSLASPSASSVAVRRGVHQIPPDAAAAATATNSNETGILQRSSHKKDTARTPSPSPPHQTTLNVARRARRMLTVPCDYATKDAASAGVGCGSDTARGLLKAAEDGGGGSDGRLLLAKMAPHDANKLRIIFHTFDKESGAPGIDGTIPNDKVVDILRLFGGNPTQDDERAMLKAIDANNDDNVSFRELCSYFAIEGTIPKRHSQKGKEEYMQKMFDAFDANSDGVIVKRELAKLLRAVGQPLTKRELTCAFAGLDLNSDGVLTFDELMRGGLA